MTIIFYELNNPQIWRQILTIRIFPILIIYFYILFNLC